MTTFGEMEIGATFQIGRALYRKITPHAATLVESNGDHRALSRTGLSDDHTVVPVAAAEVNRAA